MENLYGRNIDTKYENFIAECPHCKKENIFNRVSDLKTTALISSMEVECFECKRKFKIKGDVITETHRYLINDCYELLKLKRYRHCIINLCTACEAFFLKGIEIKLLWEPWKEKVFKRDVNIFNSYSDKLSRKAKHYTYSKLRNVFFDLYVKNKSLHSEEEIQDYITVMDCFAEIEPTNEDIQKYHDSKTRDLFVNCKNLKINEIRNNVVHKRAFRPSSDDVEKHLEEVRAVIFGLGTRLNMRQKIGYIN